MNIILSFLISFTTCVQLDFDWVSFSMVKRSTTHGMVSRIDARVFYKPSGKMVTHFISPIDMYVLNNSLGNVEIFNTKENTVVKSLDNRMGSRNTTFYYFLFGSSEDLGLSEAGFSLRESRIEDMMLVTEYTPPAAMGGLEKVELVSNGDHPVFMGYLDKDGKYLKKTYYYDYQMVRGVDFPMSITEIDFQKNDSTITKTTFSDFRFNVPEDQEFADFKTPNTATLLE